MTRSMHLMVGLGLAAASLTAGAQALVDAAWLQQRQQDPQLVLLDASPAAARRQAVIPGSRPAESYAVLLGGDAPAAVQQLFRSWGLRPDSRIVVYDQGGSWEATRVFHDLYRHGVAAGRLHLLDGGITAWRAAGGAVQPAAAAPTAPAAPGTLQIGAADPRQGATLAEVLAAAGDLKQALLIDALEPGHYFGAQRFFDRGGHLPQARNWPSSQLFDPERKTFKPRTELQAAARHLGVARGKTVHVYCGGGGAAAAPWFALKFLLDHDDVRLYSGSAREWLEDARQLPIWTYADPALRRDAVWATSWASGMLRRMGQARASVLDIRDAAAYRLGHLPDALHLDGSTLGADWADPQRLARRFAAAGLDPSHEAVVASEGGLNGPAALAWLALQRAGQQRASLLMDSPERAAELGIVLARGDAPAPKAAPSRPEAAGPGPAAAPAPVAGLPLLWLASGEALPARPPAGPLIHLPWRKLVGADGTPRPAGEIAVALQSAGVPPLARLRVRADDPGDAAAGLYLLRLMGYRDSEVATD